MVDGVNIAARVRANAEPGGICISGTAYDQLKQKVDVGYEFLGEKQVKNIAEPIRVYRALLDPEQTGRVIGLPRTPRTPWLAIASTVLVVAVVLGGWWWQPWVERVEPVNPANLAFPLPDKSSIAVLPFANLSEDASHRLA